MPDDAGYVDVFDSRTLTRTDRIPMSDGRQVSAVALAPDGRTLAAPTADGRPRLRRPARGAAARAAPAPLQRRGWSLAFSGDGRWLATAGAPTPRCAFGTSAGGRPSRPRSPCRRLRGGCRVQPRREKARRSRDRRPRRHGNRDPFRAGPRALKQVPAPEGNRCSSPPTGAYSSSATPKAASSCTTRARGGHAAVRSSATPAAWSPSTSAPTGTRWPRPPTMARRACGTSLAAADWHRAARPRRPLPRRGVRRRWHPPGDAA